MSSDPWGRVDETGTVYVRTADGEQVVGSWQAGSPEEALAYFERKYEGLVVEIGLLEKRVRTTDLSSKDAMAAIDHLREQVDAHHAVGDLQALRDKLDKLVELVEKRREERKAQRAKQSDEARRAKEDLVAEAERLAQSDQWRAAGERLRALVDTWKGLPRLDRKSDDELWHRFSHARSAFSKRRKQHFAQLDAQREEARRIKERLVAEAEELSSSTDWGPTAARYRELMAEWKAAGRAQREHEDDLWNRFRGAQDVFFAARSSVFAERDAEQAENLKLKEELAEEAEKLLPIADLEGGPGGLPVDQRALGGHRPCAARRPAEGRGPDARRRAGAAGGRGGRVAADQPGGTRACRGADRSAPGGGGQAARPDRPGAGPGQHRAGREAGA
ncbi:DNA repair ATPase OS=Streptomyces fumanus OX=67302 GN=GCM10018772_47740 PE=4 SV=1 [Streptomyces fumanus]